MKLLILLDMILLAIVAADSDGLVSRVLSGHGYEKDFCPYYCIYRAKALYFCVHKHDKCKDHIKDICDGDDDKDDYKDGYKNGYKDGLKDGKDANKCDFHKDNDYWDIKDNDYRPWRDYDAASNLTVNLSSPTDSQSDPGNAIAFDDAP